MCEDKLRGLSVTQIYVYKTDIGMDLQPARVGSYAVERVFVEQLLKSNFLTKVCRLSFLSITNYYQSSYYQKKKNQCR